MLRPDDLAGLSDFDLGALTVSPSRRTVERDDRSIAVEPRIMQMLVLLARKRGMVVTRQTLFDEIWGVPVGDDSLNRAAAGVRRALELDGEGLELETIPRTGYRLNVSGAAQRGGSWSRRQVAAGGAAALALAAGGGAWWTMRARQDRALDDLIRKGSEALAYDDRSPNAIPFFRQATELRPDAALPRGLLAYAHAMRINAPNADRAVALKEADRNATAALTLDPKQPEALLAQLLLQRSTLDFAATEDRLNALLAADPRNVRAMRNLWDLLQCVGRSREALALVERALAITPLSAVATFPRAQLLWINGRVPEADRVIDQAMAYWPTHPFVLFARYTIFAFTGREQAALAMLESPASRPAVYSADIVPVLRSTLLAMENPTPVAVGAAVKASLDHSRRFPQSPGQLMMAMSALGQLDAAFEMANDLFVGHAGARPAKGTSWRFTPFLFTPPMEAMWTDPRFEAITDAAGLTEYWSKRRIEPDFRRVTI